MVGYQPPEDPEERMVGMAGRNVLLFQGEVSRPDLLDIKGPSEASSSITWAAVVVAYFFNLVKSKDSC
jgi:hypothetical protein